MSSKLTISDLENRIQRLELKIDMLIAIVNKLSISSPSFPKEFPVFPTLSTAVKTQLVNYATQ